MLFWSPCTCVGRLDHLCLHAGSGLWWWVHCARRGWAWARLRRCWRRPAFGKKLARSIRAAYSLGPPRMRLMPLPPSGPVIPPAGWLRLPSRLPRFGFGVRCPICPCWGWLAAGRWRARWLVLPLKLGPRRPVKGMRWFPGGQLAAILSVCRGFCARVARRCVSCRAGLP